MTQKKWRKNVYGNQNLHNFDVTLYLTKASTTKKSAKHLSCNPKQEEALFSTQSPLPEP